MKLNPKLELTQHYQARIAAQEIVGAQFDYKRAVATLRPDLKGRRAVTFITKLQEHPFVRREVETIMSRAGRDAQRFSDLMWEWLEAAPDQNATEMGPVKFADKDVQERKLTAARILAKGYISEKKQPELPARPLTVDGSEKGIDVLTGDIPSERKVM